MSGEEKNPLTGEEPGAENRPEGPANRKWPSALAGSGTSDPENVRQSAPAENSGGPDGAAPEMVELTPEEFQAILAGDGDDRPGGDRSQAIHVPSGPDTAPAPGGTKDTGLIPDPSAAAVKNDGEKKTAGTKKKRRRKRRRSFSVRTPETEPKKRPAARREESDPWEAERDYMPIRGRRDGRIGCLGGLMYAVFIISLSIILAVFMWLAASDVLALNKPSLAVEVTLPQEIFSERRLDVKDEDGTVTGSRVVMAADIKSVSAILKDAGLINYKWLFQLYSRFSHADLKVNPGTYALSTSLDYRALVTKMQTGTGAQLQTLVTFPEGFDMDQIFARLEENGVCSAQALYEAAANAEFSYAFLEGVEQGDPYRLEGYLFPDSYYFYQGMQAASAINKFLSNMHYHVTEEMWQKANSLGMTFRQIMTVASIIEKEAANDDERALIASVIYNRLAQGMPLQVDSTVVYARRDTGESRVSPEIIQETDSPYNTYLHNGLPPGPICSPGMKSIEAALNPADSRYMYFALEVETRTVRFFTYYNEFEAFIATQDYG